MFGHGCPHFVLRICVLLAAIAISPAPMCAPSSASGLCRAQEFAGSLPGATQPSAKEPARQPSEVRPVGGLIKTKLRFSWGGGEAKTWQGRIAIGGGTISSIAPLGVTLDASASVKKIENGVLIDHWSPTNYGGADVELTASLDTKISFQLTSIENPESVSEQTISVEQLVGQTVAAELDGFGNRFSASRAPGDSIQVQFEKSHLVFEPRESFRFSVQPRLTGLTTRTANCRVKVVLAGATGVGSRALYSKSIQVSLDQTGSAVEPIELEIPVPNKEGVYDVQLELEPAWYQASFKAKSSGIKRSIQFVVLNQGPQAVDPQRRWRQVSVSDAVDFDQRQGISTWNQRRTGRTPLGNDLRSTTIVGEEKMVALAPGGWQAIPLEVGKIGEPHVVELEYVSSEAIAMGLSLLQPDAMGQIPLYGFDSGLFAPQSLVTREPNSPSAPKIERHRITVWPNTKTPYLLVANRHASNPITVGKVRVYAGPSELPAQPFQSARKNNRKFMAFYESPLFAENFGALAKTDTNIEEPLDDWRMFYTGAKRLIQYLKSNSYRGAFITVACEGSSIFPSKHLASTPKHDNGAFFNSGQDPIRKDVLEMLFRMFEREGLTLVPALALSTPLPEVEAFRKSGREPSLHGGSNGSEVIDGFDLVDLNSVQRQRMIGGGLPLYNPLDEKVQQAVTRIVGEIAGRYRQHNSFDGIAIVCRPDTYSLLPGRQWCYDDSTVTKFLESHQELQTNQIEEAKALLNGANRKQWIQWRADQMTGWYQDMLAELRQSVPQGKLYLAPVDLYRNEETASALSPSLHVPHDFSQVMLIVGFDLDRLQQTAVTGQTQSKPELIEGMVVLNPHRIAPEEPFSSQRVDYAVERSPQAQQFFKKANYRGDLFTHRVAWAHFEQLQRQSPFGEQASNLMRLQPMAPAQQFNRRRFVEAIKERDARLMVDGGPVLTFGQESALADLMSVFNQLPDEPFEDVLPTSARLAGDALVSPDLISHQFPIAVRQLRSQSDSFFYVANTSPWLIQLKLVLSSTQTGIPIIESFSQQKLVARRGSAQSNSATEGPLEVIFEVPAYGLVGGRSPSSGFAVEDFEFALPEGADKILKKQVYALEAKLIKSGDPAPLNAIENPNFELSGRPSLSGWDAALQSTEKVRLSLVSDTKAPGQVGTGSLVMTNPGESPVWIRSNTFEGPASGRLSIAVWLRIKENGVQPPLRLAVDGKSNGKNYYRFGSVGKSIRNGNGLQCTLMTCQSMGCPMSG